MAPMMKGSPIHSYRRPPCPRLSPAPIPVITASRLTPAPFIASMVRLVPSENTVTARRKAVPGVTVVLPSRMHPQGGTERGTKGYRCPNDRPVGTTRPTCRTPSDEGSPFEYPSVPPVPPPERHLSRVNLKTFSPPAAA